MRRKLLHICSLFATALLMLLVIAACKTSRQPHLTERLFIEPARITITHYGDNGSSRVLGEQVTYHQQQQEEEEQKVLFDGATRLDTNKVYTIPQVTVISRARFAPVREGHVDLDFVIRVPKEILSDKYQISLTPELLHNDSVVRFGDVVLRGNEFIKEQDKGYEKYNEYTSAIVDPESYNTAFVDHKAVETELSQRREKELGVYYNRWDRYQAYLAWRSKQQTEFDNYNLEQEKKLNGKLAELDSEYNKKMVRMLSVGQDTTAYSRNYRAKRNKLIADAPAFRQITIGTIPQEYQEFYVDGITRDKIKPLLPAEEDSIRIASKHIIQEEIALNKVRESRKEEVFNQLVLTPYRPDARHNATIDPEWDFVYRYTQPYPVTAGLKNLRMTLKGYVIATDRSRYDVTRVDTLTFVISSMDELADGSLVGTKGFTDAQRQEYTHAIQLLRNREYDRALKIFNNFKDYNTALTLTCMGYDKQAYDLLIQLKKNANTEYLGAILSTRLGEDNRAIHHLKQAYRLDETKANRAERDPEISKLIRKYGIQKELDGIIDAAISAN